MYLVKNVKLFDPQPMGKVDILVTNDRVAAVGNDLHPQIPGLTVIDGTGKTAVPGFIDQHVHVTGGGGEGGVPRMFSRMYFPRSTGDVRFGYDVSISTAPLPSSPYRDSSGSLTLRKRAPLTVSMP